MPSGNSENRAISLEREQGVIHTNAVSRLDEQVFESEAVAISVQLSVLGRATHVQPLPVIQCGLQSDAVKLAIAQKDDRTVLWNERVNLI